MKKTTHQKSKDRGGTQTVQLFKDTTTKLHATKREKRLRTLDDAVNYLHTMCYKLEKQIKALLLQKK